MEIEETDMHSNKKNFRSHLPHLTQYRKLFVCLFVSPGGGGCFIIILKHVQ